MPVPTQPLTVGSRAGQSVFRKAASAEKKNAPAWGLAGAYEDREHSPRPRMAAERPMPEDKDRVCL